MLLNCYGRQQSPARWRIESERSASQLQSPLRTLSPLKVRSHSMCNERCAVKSGFQFSRLNQLPSEAMKIRRQIVLALGALLCVGVAAPTQAQYRFSSWTTDNGLPQNSVNDIRQTRDGYLWLSTFDGIVRFDGVRFTVFDKGNSPGISNNRFLRLYEDTQGDLWAGTEEGGIVRYHQGRFTSYGKEQGLMTLNAYYVTADSDGHVVVYLSGGQALRFIDGKFQPFNPPNKFLENGPVRKENRRVPCPRVGDHIVCVGYGSEGWGEADGLPSLNRVGGDGIDDGRGVLWMAMTDGGLVRIEKGKVVRVFTERDGLPGSPVLFVTGA